MEVPLAGLEHLRVSAEGEDLAEHGLSGELISLQASPRQWRQGENENGFFLHAPGMDSVWLEFDVLAMQTDDQEIYFVQEGKDTIWMSEAEQKLELKVLKLDAKPPLHVSTDEFEIPLDGSRRTSRLNSMQDFSSVWRNSKLVVSLKIVSSL